MSNMLANDDKLTDEQKQLVSVIEVSSEHLVTVLNDILDFSKVKYPSLESY